MWKQQQTGRVFLALGATDMRKAINVLSYLVQEEMGEDLFTGDLFVFCSRSQKIIKILYWECNGFCLWQKRLGKDRFRWPKHDDEVMEITAESLAWLLDGLDIVQAHQRRHYTVVT